MTTLERRSTHGILPDLADWLEAPFGMFRSPSHMIRVEDYLDDGKYVIRAELPGVDPEKDVDITISGNVLQIQAEREETRKEHNRSEFHYGSFVRSMPLPAGANVKHVSAKFDNGILEITVDMPDRETTTQRVAVQTK
ncbi:MAG: Hsp20 family protein [Streptosporangiales bacterium]|nr:Hsp20 family protein [Streptosporangiales bacterium]